jgi:branched-chain amino acid transport system substrate-binding protein
MVNETQSGINGRKVNLISLDDAYSPPKTVEQTRKLVEGEGVLAMAGSIGSPGQTAVSKYLNANKIPQVIMMVGTTKLIDPVALPWTTTFYQSSLVETNIYAQFLLASKPAAKIAVLYQNDDYGRDYLGGLKAALGEKASMIVAEASYNSSDPTVDSQVIALKASGADVFFLATSPKFAAQALRKAFELDWKADRILVSAASQIPTVLKPAGVEASKGVISSQFIKYPGDPLWESDPAMKEFYSFMEKWVPGVQPDEASATYIYSAAQMIQEVLKRCGDDLTRENVIKQATHIQDIQLPLFIPGVKINITPMARTAWRQGRLASFDGAHWNYLTDIMTAPENEMRQ